MESVGDFNNRNSLHEIPMTVKSLDGSWPRNYEVGTVSQNKNEIILALDVYCGLQGHSQEYRMNTNTLYCKGDGCW